MHADPGPNQREQAVPTWKAPRYELYQPIHLKEPRI